MSLLLLIDGYNVVAPVAPPGRGVDPAWLQRERMRLLRRLAERLDDATRARTCVVFDATSPPLDRPSQFAFESIDVRFAVDYREADDLLEELIAAHSAPKQLAVVSSDHRVQAAGKRRGATAYDAQPWLDDLLEGRLKLAASTPGTGIAGGLIEDPKPDTDISQKDLRDWMETFGFDPPHQTE